MVSSLHRNASSASTSAPPKRPATVAVSMRIEEWMKTPLHTVKPHDSVAHARAILEEYRINQLPVVVGSKLVGIVTDGDLRDAPLAVRLSATAAGEPEAEAVVEPGDIAVEDVMTDAVLTLSPSDKLDKAARLMRKERVGALPILEKGRLVGILARSDILDAFVALANPRHTKGA